MAIVVGPTQWQFGTQVVAASLGSSFCGGFLICKSGGVGWIVAPNTTEVTRTWYCRDDAVTTANANAACGDWFIPTPAQLQNPGFACRSYWDSYTAAFYWSNTERTAAGAWSVRFTFGNVCGDCKTVTYLVRAFRCVTY